MLKSISLMLLAAIFALSSAALLHAEEETALAPDDEYRIAVNDVLDISVYQEPDLTKTVRVAPNGTITFPLLGNVPVVGLTARGLEERLTVLLEKDYLVNPQVSVFIKEYAKVSVLGEVKKPGSYELRAGTTAIEAIALGGGFTEIANMTDVKLTRVEGGQKRTIVIDATKITEEGGKKDDVLLKPNDIIVVEQLGMISVVGQVKKPGRFILDKNLTVIEAIALAGGLTEIASANGTKVIRKKNGKEETINVPVDSILRGSDRSKNIYLEPNDTVVVPESFF